MQSFSLSSSSPVLIGGSRRAAPGAVPPAFLLALVGAGHAVHVGCAVGADRQVVSFALSYRPAILSAFRVFAVGSSSGAGFWSGSALSSVQQFARLGGRVHWLAGGALQVPIVARLMGRSLAALAGCGAAVFFSPGVGSLKVARAALRQGVPVLVCQVGMPSAPVLPIAPVLVQWFGFSFWLYQPGTQAPLF